MKAIIAVNNLSYIGFNNGLPWKCSVDLIHFKQMTKGKIMLVGYNTYQTLPDVVKKRAIIVDAKNRIVDDYQNPELLKEICIGGKKTYEKYCKLFTELHISHIDDDTIGDVMFPDLKELNPDCKIFHYYFNVDKETPISEYDEIYEDVKDVFKEDHVYDIDDGGITPLNRVCLFKDNDDWYYVEVTMDGVDMPKFDSSDFDKAFKFFYTKVKETGLSFYSI